MSNFEKFAKKVGEDEADAKIPPTGGSAIIPAREQLSFAEQQELRKIIREQLEGEYIKKFEAERTQLREQNTIAIQEALAKLQRDNKPPTTEEIEQLLDQEYVTITLKLRIDDKTRQFVLGELPMGIERKFLKILTDKLKPKIAMLGQLVGATLLEGTVEDKLKAVYELVDPSAEILCELVALVLNPYGREPYFTEGHSGTRTVDAEWVGTYLPLWRCWNILMAQASINRVRDFFSAVFQDSNVGMMITKANSPR